MDQAPTTVSSTAAASGSSDFEATPSVEAGSGSDAVLAADLSAAIAAATAAAESAGAGAGAGAGDSPAVKTAGAEASGKKKKKKRCTTCRAKLGLLGFECRCERMFCDKHRHPDEHECTFDHKADNKRVLEARNKRVVADKVQRI